MFQIHDHNGTCCFPYQLVTTPTPFWLQAEAGRPAQHISSRMQRPRRRMDHRLYLASCLQSLKAAAVQGHCCNKTSMLHLTCQVAAWRANQGMRQLPLVRP